MRRRIVFVLLLFFLTLFLLSCNKKTDPFVTTAETTENGNIPITNIAFSYGLNSAESYDKYGMMSYIYAANMDNSYDGKYIYGLSNVTIGEVSVIGKYEWQNKTKVTAACTDPLCTHGVECPFYGAGAFGVACYEDSVYYIANDHVIYRYDKESNKRTAIVSDCINAKFLKYNNNLYFSFRTEQNDTDFIIYRKFFRITPGESMTELGQLQISDICMETGIVYEDKYYIDYKAEIINGKAQVSLLKRSLETINVTTAAMIQSSRDAEKIGDILSYMLYGDKLLVRLEYYKNQTQYIDIWIVDLKTGEKQLVCTPDLSTYDENTWCLFSQKCYIWHEPRHKEADPLIAHVSFPYTGEEKTYDLSKSVYDATGDTLPLDVKILDMMNSAIRLYMADENGKYYVVYEIDLENGNVRKNDIE